MSKVSDLAGELGVALLREGRRREKAPKALVDLGDLVFPIVDDLLEVHADLRVDQINRPDRRLLNSRARPS